MLTQITWQPRLTAAFLLSVLTILIGYLFLLKPQYYLLKTQTNQIMQLKEKIKSSTDNINHWRQLRSRFSPLLRFHDQHALLELISEQAETHGVSLLSIKPVEKHSKQAEPNETLQMEMRANFFSFMAWLESLDKQGIPFAVQALTIIPGTDQQTLWLEIKLSLQLPRLDGAELGK